MTANDGTSPSLSPTRPARLLPDIGIAVPAVVVAAARRVAGLGHPAVEPGAEVGLGAARRLRRSAMFLTWCGSRSRSYSSSAGRFANAEAEDGRRLGSSRRSRIRSLVGERVDVAERADRLVRAPGRPPASGRGGGCGCRGIRASGSRGWGSSGRPARTFACRSRSRKTRVARRGGRARPREQVEQAPAGHRRRRLQPGGFEERRGQVGVADEGVDRPAPLDPRRPADRQGHVRARVVQVRLAAREGHAVVAGDDDERVRRPARRRPAPRGSRRRRGRTARPRSSNRGCRRGPRACRAGTAGRRRARASGPAARRCRRS